MNLKEFSDGKNVFNQLVLFQYYGTISKTHLSDLQAYWAVWYLCVFYSYMLAYAISRLDCKGEYTSLTNKYF